MISLADPWFLFLLPLPLLILRLAPPVTRTGGALRIPGVIGERLLGKHRAGESVAQNLGLPVAIWVLLVVALAGPRLIVPTPALPTSGRDIVIALDLSGSMVEEDFFIDDRQVSRLDAVKHVGTEFARRRAGDRVALVIFGSKAYFATPFTFDTEAVARAIDEATIGLSGRATSISDALGLSLKRLVQSDAASKVIVLLSDGANNSGAATPRDAARLAREKGVRVHTIAMGPRDVTNPGDERDVVDTVTLKAIADISGGQTFRVKTTDDLVAVTEELDRLEASPTEGVAAEIYAELWTYPAALALLLLTTQQLGVRLLSRRSEPVAKGHMA
jgi:Ca-activated chloride channel homolog